MERLLLHRTACKGVDRPLIGARVVFQRLLDERDDRRLAARRRAEQQQDPLPGLRAPRGGLEVLHDSLQHVFHSEDIVFEELVDRLSGRRSVHALGKDRVPDPRVGQLHHGGVLDHHSKIVGEGALPLVERRLTPARGQDLLDRHGRVGHIRCPLGDAVQRRLASRYGALRGLGDQPSADCQPDKRNGPSAHQQEPCRHRP